MRFDEMLTTGNQLKAARALTGLSQGELAQRAKVNINTISTMEKKGPEMLTSGFDIVTRVARALEAMGVEFLNHGAPGVRLHNKPKGASSKAAVRRRDPVKRSRPG